MSLARLDATARHRRVSTEVRRFTRSGGLGPEFCGTRIYHWCLEESEAHRRNGAASRPRSLQLL